MSADATCAICGRTLRAGERVQGYVEGAEERPVCAPCVTRAERLGWRPAGEPGPERRTSVVHGGRGRFRNLLRRRGRRPGAPRAAAAPVAQPPEQPLLPDPAAAPRRPRSAPPRDAAAPTPFQRAVVSFNSSEAGRTVAGLVRTLGAPRASVGASAGAPGEVRITVAWELSWYQWGVDPEAEMRSVFQIDKGGEIDQLDAAARQWNASVGEDGKLRLAAEPAPSR